MGWESGLGRGQGGVREGGCEPRIELIVKMQKKFQGGGGGGREKKKVGDGGCM